MRPGFASVLPLARHGVHRIKIRVVLDEIAEASFGELHRARKNIFLGFCLKFNHRMPL